MEVEIDAAERFGCVTLAQNDSDKFVESNAMAELGSAVFVCLYRLVQQRDKRRVKFIGRFVDADHVAIVIPHRLRNLLVEHFDSHMSHLRIGIAKVKPKMTPNGMNQAPTLNPGAPAEP